MDTDFDSAPADANYDDWLRAKVKVAIADKRPLIPHDQVVAEMEALLESIASAHAI